MKSTADEALKCRTMSKKRCAHFVSVLFQIHLFYFRSTLVPWAIPVV